jgi:hypothetical protein
MDCVVCVAHKLFVKKTTLRPSGTQRISFSRRSENRLRDSASIHGNWSLMVTRIKYCATEVIDMSTKIGSDFSCANLRLVFIGLFAMSVSGVVLAAPENGDSGTTEIKRSSISLHTVRGGRDNPTDIRETTEDYGALLTSGDRSKSGTRNSLSKPGVAGAIADSASFDFWFFEADVILYNDDDNDGYFYGIYLLFDVDTKFSSADIYAVLYLSYEGGPWNEYAATEDFSIFGSSGSDEYVIETELMSGYLTGSYDLLIEVFDAFDGSFLTSFGPSDTSELAYLPLEDFNRDEPITVVIVSEHGGGGALDHWLLSGLVLLLMISAVRKIWRRRNDALVRIDSPPACWQSLK